MSVQERPLLGVFIAALVVQKAKKLKELGYFVAFQCATLMVKNFHLYTTAPTAEALAQDHTANKRIEFTTWHLANDRFLRGEAQTPETALSDMNLHLNGVKCLQAPRPQF